MTDPTHHRTVRDLIRTATQSGIKLGVDGDRLYCKAPRGGIPDELKNALRAQREALIGELSAPVFRRRADPPATIRYPPFWMDFWQETQANPGLRHGTHLVMRFVGHVGLESIRAALDSLTSRHDLLRCSVWCDEAAPCLRLEQPQPAATDFVDVSGEPDADRAMHAKDIVFRAIYSPFAAGQIYRATILKLSGEEHVIAIAVHHFVVDGFTCDILAAELAASLREAHQPQTRPPPVAVERPLQYSDYLLAMNEWLSGPGPGYRLGFWREKMRLAPPVHLAPARIADSPRALEAESFKLHVTSVVREGVARAAAEAAIPMPVALLAAKIAALSWSLHSNDVVVVVLHWGRDERLLLDMVGLTINCIPVRVPIRPEMTCLDLLTSVNDSYVLARDYQVPWALLQRSLGEVGGAPAAPLFNYMNQESFGSNGPDASRPRPPLVIERIRVPAPNDSISVDWKTHEFTVFDDGKELFASLKYLPSRYDTTAVREFADNFRRCLNAIRTDPTQSLRAASGCG